MDNFLELLKKRRSIRKFKTQPVDESVLRYIIECGLNSPSACNKQPYRFVVMRGEAKDKFCRSVFGGIYSFCSFVSKAPVIIALVRNKKSFEMKIGEVIANCDFSLIDIGICGQNMVIAATEKGLGSLWVGWFDRKKANKFLKVGTQETVEILIAIGEKDEDPPPRKKKDFSSAVMFVD